MTQNSPRARSTMLAAAPAVALVLAAGFVHLREWFSAYRNVPGVIPGAAVVRIGFPVNAALSVVLAGLLVIAALRTTRWMTIVIVAIAGFEVASLAALVLSRTSNVFGWMETGWGVGATQTRALEIGALVALAFLAGIRLLQTNHGEHASPRDARRVRTTAAIHSA